MRSIILQTLLLLRGSDTAQSANEVQCYRSAATRADSGMRSSTEDHWHDGYRAAERPLVDLYPTAKLKSFSDVSLPVTCYLL